MKRIITLLLSVVFVASLINIYAVEVPDNAYEVERSLGILNAIGQFSEYNIETIEHSKEITRGEFAQGLADILKMTASSDKLFYHDVSKEHFAYNGITAITEAGYMNGCGNNRFEPDRIMTRNEAAIVLVSALGYRQEAIAKGGDELTYVKIASRMELFDGTVSGRALTFDDMLVMLANSLLAPVMEMYVWGERKVFDESDDETILSIYYNSCYVEEERVTYANNTGIYSETQYDDFVKIGNHSYIPIKNNMGDYLGSYVNFIYRGDINKGDCEIIWIEKAPGYDELIIDGDDITGFDSGSYKYTYYAENGKETELSISRNISVIYNGKFESESGEYLSRPCSEIRFIENVDGVIDVAIMQSYTNYIIETINPTDGFMVVRDGANPISINDGDYNKLIIEDSFGNTQTQDVLEADKTVSIFASSDESYMKFILSDLTAEGTVLEVKNSDGHTKIKINENQYRLSDTVYAQNVKVGDTAFAYIDFKGHISYLKPNYTSVFVAYIVETSVSGVFSTPKVRAFTQNGKFEIYDVVEKIRVDNKQFNDIGGDGFYEFANAVNEQLVTLEFNNDGKIKKIDTSTGEGALKITAPFGTCNYRSISAKIGKLTCIDSSTKIFSIPENPKTAKEDEFRMMVKSGLGDWRTFEAESYAWSDDTSYAGAVLIKGFNWSAATDTSTAFVYADSYEGLNDDGEVIHILRGYEGSVEKTYYCDNSYTPIGLTPGCVMMLVTNGSGKVIGYDKLFDRDSAGGESTGSLVANRRVVLGYVNDRKGSVIGVGYTDPKTIDEKFDCTGTPIIVVDEDSRSDVKVKIGSASDIMSYRNSVTDYDKIGIQTMQMSQRMIVVYK